MSYYCYDMSNLMLGGVPQNIDYPQNILVTTAPVVTSCQASFYCNSQGL